MTPSYGQLQALCDQQEQLYAAAQSALDEGDYDYVQACMDAVVSLAPAITQLNTAVWEEVLLPLVTEPEMLTPTTN